MTQTHSDAGMADSITHALKGHAAAIALFMLWRDVLHFWDDLVDQDQAISRRDIDLSMFKALVAIPSNGFYRQFQDQLQPILISAIANWQAATEFEKTLDQRKLEIAYVIRSDYANLLIHMAYLVGGYDWMVEVTPQIRAQWSSEDFTEYLANLAAEIVARDTTL